MITVVIASYNYGHLAAHCIETVLGQSQRPEILFVDDGAGDCKHLQKIYPEVEYVLRPKNLGIVDNFNDMLDRVQTERVMFLGADNWLRTDAIERLSKSKADVTTYDIMVVGELRDEIKGRHENELKALEPEIYWKREHSHHGSMVYKTKLGKRYRYSQNGGTRSEEDENLWNKLIRNQASVEYIPEAFLYYRRHRENFNK